MHNPPLNLPFNGGMNSTIPLLGGVALCGGEGVFIFYFFYCLSLEKDKKDWLNEIATSYNTFLAMTDWVNEILMPSQNEGSG